MDGDTPHGASPVEAVLAQKTALRDRLVTGRSRRPLAEVGEAAHALARVLLGLPEVRRAATVTAYASVGNEPGTSPLLDALVAADKRVLLPICLPGHDLDWAPYDGPSSLVSARFGLLEPVTPRLGVDAVAGVDALLVPGLGVDRTGARIGRGAGFYDRALARVPAGTFVCAVLYDDEVVEHVPTEPHDQRVRAVATPSGVLRLPATTAG